MRRREQFYCTECHKYFLVYLRSSMFGNYTVVCCNCDHEHFRVIDKGVVTQERHDKRLGQSEKIMVLKATLRDKSYENEAWYARRNMQIMRG